MSETPPSEGDFDRGAPAPPTQTANAGMPRQYHVPPGEPLPPKPKRKLAWGWFFVGLATPFVLYVLSTYVFSLTASSSVFGVAAGAVQILNVAAFVGAIGAFVYGLTRERNDLRSLGLGALTAYGLTVLLTLLLFGACLVSLSNFGN